MMTSMILGWVLPLLSITHSEESISFQEKPHHFEIEEFAYVYDKLQELIDEVQSLKEGATPQKLTTDEWKELLFPIEEQFEAHESIPESIESDWHHIVEDSSQ